jgi:hypothetical protein
MISSIRPRFGFGAPQCGHVTSASILGRSEDLAPGPVPNFHRKAFGIRRIRVEMSDGFLQPGKDIGHPEHIGLGQEAVQAIAEPDVYVTVPPPGDLDIDLAVIDFLEFIRLDP